MFTPREINNIIQGCFQERARDCGRESVNMTKCNVNKTLKQCLVHEHFFLSHIG